MKKLGLKDLGLAVLKRIGLPEIEPITTQATPHASDSEVADDPDGLPPELADYPGVRKLFAQAQKQQLESAEPGASLVSGRPDDTKSTEAVNLPSSLSVNGSSDAQASAAVERRVEQAKDSAVRSPINQPISPDGSLNEAPANVEALQQGEKQYESSVAVRADESRPSLDTAVPRKPDKRTAIPLLSKVFDWIVLLLLCIGLAFAITALATLFKTSQTPH
jgi:hypothetical protein